MWIEDEGENVPMWHSRMGISARECMKALTKSWRTQVRKGLTKTSIPDVSDLHAQKKLKKM